MDAAGVHALALEVQGHGAREDDQGWEGAQGTQPSPCELQDPGAVGTCRLSVTSFALAGRFEAGEAGPRFHGLRAGGAVRQDLAPAWAEGTVVLHGRHERERSPGPAPDLGQGRQNTRLKHVVDVKHARPRLLEQRGELGEDLVGIALPSPETAHPKDALNLWSARRPVVPAHGEAEVAAFDARLEQ